MATAVALAFRFAMYTMFGLTMETLSATGPIELILGRAVPRRVPRRYLEGFVSAWMIPLHGLGGLFLFEPARQAIADLPWLARFGLYGVGITIAEALWGFLCDKVLGFYPWDYYQDSRFRVFRRGYTLWTLLPCWGLAGLALEVYSDLMVTLSPHVVRFFGQG